MYSTVDNIFHFSYFDPDYPTSELTVTGLGRVYSTRTYREQKTKDRMSKQANV
jgi:hypothetical protein